MHQNMLLVIEERLGGGDHTLPHPLSLRKFGVELKKIVKNFMRDGLSLCLIAMICRGRKNEANGKLDILSRELKKGVKNHPEEAELILRQ